MHTSPLAQAAIYFCMTFSIFHVSAEECILGVKSKLALYSWYVYPSPGSVRVPMDMNIHKQLWAYLRSLLPPRKLEPVAGTSPPSTVLETAPITLEERWKHSAVIVRGLYLQQPPTGKSVDGFLIRGLQKQDNGDVNFLQVFFFILLMRTDFGAFFESSATSFKGTRSGSEWYT